MIPLSYRPGGNMNILLISLPEKNKDMKLEATEVLPLALYSLQKTFLLFEKTGKLRGLLL